MNKVIVRVHRPTSTLDLEGSAARVSTFLAVLAVTSAVVTWGKHTSAAEAPVTTLLLLHCDLMFVSVIWISQLSYLSVCFWDNKYFPCLLIYLSCQCNPFPLCSPSPFVPPSVFPGGCQRKPVHSCRVPVLHTVDDTASIPASSWSPWWQPPQVIFFFLLVIHFLLSHPKGTEYSPSHYLHCIHR